MYIDLYIWLLSVHVMAFRVRLTALVILNIAGANGGGAGGGAGADGDGGRAHAGAGLCLCATIRVSGAVRVGSVDRNGAHAHPDRM